MKKLIKFGGTEFIGDEIAFDVPEHLAELILNYSSKDELIRIIDAQIEHENYEGAQRIKDKLDEIK